MNIHNDYRILETELRKMQQQLETLQSIRKGLSSDIDKLYQSGFRDSKFVELKGALTRDSAEIQKAEGYFQRCVDELNTRAGLIKEYYAVNL